MVLWLKWTVFFYLLVSALGVGQALLDRSHRRCVQSCRTNQTCVASCDAAAGVE